jgi:hypothetical protein
VFLLLRHYQYAPFDSHHFEVFFEPDESTDVEQVLSDYAVAAVSLTSNSVEMEYLIYDTSVGRALRQWTKREQFSSP